MSPRLTFFAGWLLLSLTSRAQMAVQERWEQGYTNEDATGAHVLGFWKFDGGFAQSDATGKGGDLKLDGAVLSAEGRFGQSLDATPELPVQSKRHAALAAASPVLSPQGAFSMEMWIRLKPNFNPALVFCLLDKKDVDHTDYQWQISAEEKPGVRRMLVTLGFGGDSKVFRSTPIKLTADVWQHVAFTYDAAGSVTFHLNGRPAGGMKLDGCGRMAPGTKPLSIGDSIGNAYAGFPGLIDEVRLCNGVLNFAPLALKILTSRTIWQRMDAGNRIQVFTTNLRREVTSQPELKLALGDREQVVTLSDLNPVNLSRSTKKAIFNMDTTLKPGKYVLRATAQSGTHFAEQAAEFQILPRTVPHMPVVMLSASGADFSKLHELGFSHFAFDRSDLWTACDHGLPQPGIIGDGVQVNALAHAADSFPSPLFVGLNTDQLLALNTVSGKQQKVMLMAALAWDRSKTAPAGNREPGFKVSWEIDHPEATSITVAPMLLRETFWTAMARPVQGIIFSGWQSLLDVPDSDGVQHQTNPDAERVLKELLQDVVKPLGTTLMLIPDAPSDVALLESTPSQKFATRDALDEDHAWTTDLWLAMQHAHVQTDILFEETLLKGGLEGRKVLFMPECAALSQSLITHINEWQKKGGRIIADEFLIPAIKADITLPSFMRSHNARQDKTKVLALAKTIPAHMQSFGWGPGISCDNPEIIVRTRRFGDALYVFVVNDFREPGNYVGQHGRVMENGLPSSGVLTLHQDSANVYDLTRSSFVLPKRDASGDPSWQLDLGPCDGRIFMVTPKPLLGIQLEVPESATCGNTASINVAITTTKDTPVQAVIPVEIQIRDANGSPAEGSGHYAAENGIVSLILDIAPNEDPGTWEIRVRELASGMQAVKWMRIIR